MDSAIEKKKDLEVGLLSSQTKSTAAGISTYHVASLVGVLMMLPVVFFGVYPAIVIGFVKSAGMQTNFVTITNPTNVSFDTSVNFNFDTASPIQASIQLKSVGLIWNGPGGGNLVDVQNVNKLDASTKRSQTLSGLGMVQNAFALVNFIDYAIYQPSVDWEMSSNHAMVSSGLGSVQVDILKTASIGGFNNFSIPPNVLSVNTTVGTPTYIVNYALIELVTNSRIVFEFGQDVNFIVRSRNIPIGWGFIPNAAFQTGTFQVNATIYMETHSIQEADELNLMLSNYIMGNDIDMSLSDLSLPNPIVWLTPALDSIHLSATINGLTQKLLQYVEIFSSTFSLIKKTINFDGNLYNPIMAEMHIKQMIGQIYYNGSLVGDMNVKNQNIYVPGLSNITTPLLLANVLDLNLATELLKQREGLVDVVFQLIQIDVGEYPVSVVYNQTDIPCYVRK